MANNNENKILNVPHLRFPEFTGEWKKCVLQDVVAFSNGKAHENCVNENGDYVLVNSKFVSTNGQVQKRVTSQLSPLCKSQFVMVMSDLPNGKALAKCYYIEDDHKFTLNQRICSFTAKDRNISRFLMYQINRNKYYMRFDDGINQTNLKKSEVLSCPVFIPSIHEQEKIATMLHLLDERIATQTKIIEDLKKLKSAIRKRRFSLLKDEHTESFEINQLLTYEQPTPYIVANDEYSKDTTLIPALTANKGFILGYTDEDFGVYQKGECIIFDDFTMDAKYVSFPFKVKSSAIKILTARPCVNLRFMFEYLSYLELKSEEHKRHYISEIASLVIEVPSLKRQNKIAFLMTSLDNKLTLEENAKLRYEDKKQYLLSQMFI